jgi:aspartate aminotransferase/aminotransferase
LLPDPGWPNYESIVHLAGGRAVRFAQPASRGFLPDVAAIEKLIGPRTKAILVNTPGNPTGAVFPRSLMEDLGRLTARHGIYLISDEVYEDFVFDGEHFGALTCAPEDRTLVVSGFSKSYAMTGWRLGYLICPPSIAPLAGAIQEPVTSCPSAPSQAAAEAALAGDQSAVRSFCDIYKRRRDILADVFAESGALPVVPQGAFYGFIDIGASGEGSVSFAKRLLQERAVAAVPGLTFGPASDGFIRVAFTIEDDRLRQALTRIQGMLG